MEFDSRTKGIPTMTQAAFDFDCSVSEPEGDYSQAVAFPSARGFSAELEIPDISFESFKDAFALTKNNRNKVDKKILF